VAELTRLSALDTQVAELTRDRLSALEMQVAELTRQLAELTRSRQPSTPPSASAASDSAWWNDVDAVDVTPPI